MAFKHKVSYNNKHASIGDVFNEYMGKYLGMKSF